MEWFRQAEEWTCTSDEECSKPAFWVNQDPKAPAWNADALCDEHVAAWLEGKLPAFPNPGGEGQ